MKVKQFKVQDGSNGYAVIPDLMRNELKGLSINEALARKLIDDIGDEKGEFLFNHERYNDPDNPVKASYGIVGLKGITYAVRISEGLEASADALNEVIGQLRFQVGISETPGEGLGKPWFRLSLPAGVRLGKAIGKIAAETVAS